MKYRKLVVVLVVITIQSLQFGSSHNLNEFIGIGRSIAGIISSGFSDFMEVHKKISFKDKENQVRGNLKHENISTDDLFSGLSEVWNSKENVSESFSLNKEKKEIKERKEPELNMVPKEHKDEQGMEGMENQSHVQTTEISVNYDTQVEESNHWMRIKAIVGNMKSLFLQTYGEDSTNKMDILKMLDKMMEIGDKINEVQKIGDSFNHDLLEFLKEKWLDVEHQIISTNPILKTMLSIDGKVLLVTIARGLLKQFGHAFHKQALAHINEQDFVIETMRVSGFKDSEIYDVFQLLDLPTEALVSSSKTLKTEDEGRNYFSFSDLFSRSGGYGGGSHHGGGYGAMMKKDPLLLLAGLAFATFAAYIIYRLLSSTPAVRRRAFPDFSISLTLSDMPEVIAKITHWLEKTENLYGNPDEEMEEMEEMEDGKFANSINELWESFQVDRMSRDCVRRYLCHHLKTNTYNILRHGTNFEQLTLLALSELMGEKGAGKVIDSYVTKLMKGEMVDCRLNSPSCDDPEFTSVINGPKIL